MRFQIFLYHVMVLMAERGVSWADITKELAKDRQDNQLEGI